MERSEHKLMSEFIPVRHDFWRTRDFRYYYSFSSLFLVFVFIATTGLPL